MSLCVYNVIHTIYVVSKRMYTPIRVVYYRGIIFCFFVLSCSHFSSSLGVVGNTNLL